jgi:cell division protein ZapA
MTDATTVTVRILDKDYQISCAPDEVSALRQSASFVDDKMREVKENSNILGLDRLAVMVALNIANDYLSHSEQSDAVSSSREENLRALSGKLDQAITRYRKT